MTWTPIEESDLATMIAAAVAAMSPRARSFWCLLRVRPVKWRLSPWGDLGGGFRVVGLLGERVVWFNDIEWGFNVSRYADHGRIAKYWCNQDELQPMMDSLLRELANGEAPVRRGPPEPLDSISWKGRQGGQDAEL